MKDTPEAELTNLMNSAQRSWILGTIMSWFPARFRPDRAGSVQVVVHWHITGPPRATPDAFELVIANGTCTLSPAPAHEPTLALTVGPVDFLRLVGGISNPMMMFMTGKLKAKGDLGLAANLANLFDLKRA
ncbi:SCP2 sterol-binding domain-containing protein [Dactylosporangium sp. NPDC049525]|uniref:SCP2 sterol-binding domain-containing protein n=1 Tax=Dactylosporangium sp. NPDC049525 TaxID=3154730 RepID=UPI00342A3303